MAHETLAVNRPREGSPELFQNRVDQALSLARAKAEKDMWATPAVGADGRLFQVGDLSGNNPEAGTILGLGWNESNWNPGSAIKEFAEARGHVLGGVSRIVQDSAAHLSTHQGGILENAISATLLAQANSTTQGLQNIFDGARTDINHLSEDELAQFGFGFLQESESESDSFIGQLEERRTKQVEKNRLYYRQAAGYKKIQKWFSSWRGEARGRKLEARLKKLSTSVGNSREAALFDKTVEIQGIRSQVQRRFDELSNSWNDEGLVALNEFLSYIIQHTQDFLNGNFREASFFINNLPGSGSLDLANDWPNFFGVNPERPDDLIDALLYGSYGREDLDQEKNSFAMATVAEANSHHQNKNIASLQERYQRVDEAFFGRSNPESDEDDSEHDGILMRADFSGVYQALSSKLKVTPSRPLGDAEEMFGEIENHLDAKGIQIDPSLINEQQVAKGRGALPWTSRFCYLIVWLQEDLNNLHYFDTDVQHLLCGFLRHYASQAERHISKGTVEEEGRAANFIFVQHCAEATDLATVVMKDFADGEENFQHLIYRASQEGAEEADGSKAAAMLSRLERLMHLHKEYYLGGDEKNHAECFSKVSESRFTREIYTKLQNNWRKISNVVESAALYEKRWKNTALLLRLEKQRGELLESIRTGESATLTKDSSTVRQETTSQSAEAQLDKINQQIEELEGNITGIQDIPVGNFSEEATTMKDLSQEVKRRRDEIAENVDRVGAARQEYMKRLLGADLAAAHTEITRTNYQREMMVEGQSGLADLLKGMRQQLPGAVCSLELQMVSDGSTGTRSIHHQRKHMEEAILLPYNADTTRRYFRGKIDGIEGILILDEKIASHPSRQTIGRCAFLAGETTAEGAAGNMEVMESQGRGSWYLLNNGVIGNDAKPQWAEAPGDGWKRYRDWQAEGIGSLRPEEPITLQEQYQAAQEQANTRNLERNIKPALNAQYYADCLHCIDQWTDENRWPDYATASSGEEEMVETSGEGGPSMEAIERLKALIDSDKTSPRSAEGIPTAPLQNPVIDRTRTKQESDAQTVPQAQDVQTKNEETEVFVRPGQIIDKANTSDGGEVRIEVPTGDDGSPERQAPYNVVESFFRGADGIGQTIAILQNRTIITRLEATLQDNVEARRAFTSQIIARLDASSDLRPSRNRQHETTLLWYTAVRRGWVTPEDLSNHQELIPDIVHHLPASYVSVPCLQHMYQRGFFDNQETLNASLSPEVIHRLTEGTRVDPNRTHMEAMLESTRLGERLPAAKEPEKDTTSPSPSSSDTTTSDKSKSDSGTAEPTSKPAAPDDSSKVPNLDEAVEIDWAPIVPDTVYDVSDNVWGTIGRGYGFAQTEIGYDDEPLPSLHDTVPADSPPESSDEEPPSEEEPPAQGPEGPNESDIEAISSAFLALPTRPRIRNFLSNPENLATLTQLLTPATRGDELRIPFINNIIRILQEEDLSECRGPQASIGAFMLEWLCNQGAITRDSFQSLGTSPKGNIIRALPPNRSGINSAMELIRNQIYGRRAMFRPRWRNYLARFGETSVQQELRRQLRQCLIQHGIFDPGFDEPAAEE